MPLGVAGVALDWRITGEAVGCIILNTWISKSKFGFVSLQPQRLRFLLFVADRASGGNSAEAGQRDTVYHNSWCRDNRDGQYPRTVCTPEPMV